MKVIFLIPPPLDGRKAVERCYGCNYGLYFLPPLAALYAATVLREAGFEVKVRDLAAEGVSRSGFEDYVRNSDADIYVFYTVFLSEATDIEARRTIRRLARNNPVFIYCGTQPTWKPENFLDAEDTYVVRGEPEYPLRDLIVRLSSSLPVNDVPGVSYLRNGVVVSSESTGFVQNIDELPIPDRSLVDHSYYYNPKMHHHPHTAALTSRGCFAQCTFCVPNSLSFAREIEYKKQRGRKPPPRLHSVERVIAEFRAIAAAGFRSVSVMDDEFLWNEERDIAICEGVKDLGLEWSCLARADKITERNARALAEAGCSYVDIGVESFDEAVLKDIKKDVEVERIKNAVLILKENRIKVELNILLGASPLETEKTIRATIDAVRSMDVDYVLFNIASPFPGTEFYERAKLNRWFVTPNNEYVPVDPSQESIISYPHLDKKRLDSLLSYAYRTYYFNPHYIISQLFKVTSFRDFKNKAVTAARTFARNILFRK